MSSIKTRYEIKKQLGDGAFGSVFLALSRESKEVVAIKQMKQKYMKWEDCLALREVKALKKLSSHPNIVKLKEVLRDSDGTLAFVFEFMDGNLFQLITDRQGIRFQESKAKSIIHQILKGLSYMHSKGFFHRDLKPENLLTKNESVKIADLGLAREIRSRPPYTEYVSTRWYRAPEVILNQPNYSSPIDLWAVGAIIAEVCTLDPLFPGESEIDQIHKICTIVGSPTSESTTAGGMIGLSEYYTLQNTSKVNPRTLAGGGSWLDGIKLAREQSFIFVSNPVRPLCELVPDIPIEALQLLSDMLKYDPAKRPTAAAALKHPWFSVLESESLPPRPVQKQPIGSNHSFQKLSSLETVDDNRSAFVPSKVNIGSQITSSFSGNQLNQSVSGTSLNRPEQFKYDSIPQKQYAPLNPIQKQPLALNFQKHVYSNQNQNPLDQTYSNSILSPTLKFQGVIHKSPTFDYQERVNNQSGYQERNSEYQERGINKSPTLNFQERGPTKSPTFEYTKPKLTKSKTFDAGFQFQKPRQEKLPALRQISVLDKLEILQNTGPKPGVPPKIKELSVFGKSVAGGFDRGDGHIQIGLNRYNDVIKEARRQNQHGLFGDDRRR